LTQTRRVAGRTFKEVCSARPEKAKLWQTELSMFAGWGEDVDEPAKKVEEVGKAGKVSSL
jgi:hypothetical protein